MTRFINEGKVVIDTYSRLHVPFVNEDSAHLFARYFNEGVADGSGIENPATWLWENEWGDEVVFPEYIELVDVVTTVPCDPEIGDEVRCLTEAEFDELFQVPCDPEIGDEVRCLTEAEFDVFFCA